MIISQGDQYAIPIAINIDDVPVDIVQIDDVEIVIGHIRKTLKNGEVKYNEVDQTFLFPVTQEETFDLGLNVREGQVRVKFRSGDVLGTSLGKIDVEKSISEVII